MYIDFTIRVISVGGEQMVTFPSHPPCVYRNDGLGRRGSQSLRPRLFTLCCCLMMNYYFDATGGRPEVKEGKISHTAVWCTKPPFVDDSLYNNIPPSLVCSFHECKCRVGIRRRSCPSVSVGLFRSLTHCQRDSDQYRHIRPASINQRRFEVLIGHYEARV